MGWSYTLVTAYKCDDWRDEFPGHSEPQVWPFPSHGFYVITESVNTFMETKNGVVFFMSQAFFHLYCVNKDLYSGNTS